MIQKFEAGDIIKILKMDDHIEELFPCDKGEWIQWLMGILENPRFLIVGTEDSYLVASDNVMLPISASVSILMCYSNEGNVKELKDAVSKWALNCGAREVRFITRDISMFMSYGVEKLADLGGWSL